MSPFRAKADNGIQNQSDFVFPAKIIELAAHARMSSGFSGSAIKISPACC
jgi:hypothetical protein